MAEKFEMAEDGKPLPRLVQSPGENAEVKLDVAPSSDLQFAAAPHDGVWNSADLAGEPASREEQVAAFADYVQRPDIESRESILARENALPGQFSTANVASGSVDDGLAADGKGGVEESDEAKEEADSIKGVTAADKGKGKN